MDDSELGAGRGSADPVASRGARLYLGVFIFFFLLYALTAQRGPAWQDSGMYQLRILDFQIYSELGLALSHPLLIVLGKAFSLLPFGPLAWRLNLPSALAGAVAVANVALLVRRLAPERPGAALLAGGFFGLAHTTWWLGTICESQAVFVALFTTELHVLVRLVRRPAAATVLLGAILNGLALTAHNLALLSGPIWLMTVLYLSRRGELPWRSLAVLAGGWALGASGYLAMVARSAAEDGLAPAIHSALFGSLWVEEVFAASGSRAVSGAGYVLFNFPNLALPLALAGLWMMRKRLPRALSCGLGGLTAIYLLFAIRYDVLDQFMFFLPFYALVSVLAGMGLAWLCSAGRRKTLITLTAASMLAGPVLYLAAPRIWREFSLPLPGRKDLPYRDPGRYWLVPWKADEDSAERYARVVLQRMPSGGVLLADTTTFPPLQWVQRFDGLAPQAVLLHRTVALPDALIGREDVFVASAVRGGYPKELDALATLRKDAPDDLVYRVVWNEESDDDDSP